jgi:outer membrane protein assembly factor BamB
MDIQPLHTKIEKSIQSSYGIIVLEHYSGFPRGESNLYCVAQNGEVVWKAEKPDSYTLYSRVRFNEDGMSLSTYTINGHACDIDPQTGKILGTTSIQ